MKRYIPDYPQPIDLKKITGYRKGCFIEDELLDCAFLHPVTDAIIRLAPEVKLERILRNNIEEWWYRLCWLRIAYGYKHFLNPGFKYLALLKQDLAAHRGIFIHIGDPLSRNQWIKHQLEQIDQRINDRFPGDFDTLMVDNGWVDKRDIALNLWKRKQVELLKFGEQSK